MTTETSSVTANTITATAVMLDPSNPPAHGLFDAVFTDANEITLVPRNVAAAAILQSLLAANVSLACEYGDGKGAAKRLRGLRMRFDHPPILSTGGDPHTRGIVLSQEEMVETTALVVRKRENRPPPPPSMQRRMPPQKAQRSTNGKRPRK